MALNIDFSENDLAPEDTPKAMGGTELSQKWLFDRLDPELRDYFQFIASRKRKMEDKPKLFFSSTRPFFHLSISLFYLSHLKLLRNFN